MSPELPPDELPIVIIDDQALGFADGESNGDSHDRRPTGAGRAAPRFFLVCGVAALILGGVLLVFGSGYYRLPPERRHFHDLHALLRSSGHAGLVFGLAGTALMLLNLTYLVRKRFPSVRWVGSLRRWMGFHVLTGLVGPGLILFHSAFTLQSALGALAFSAMLLVVLTGLVGRYIYAQVPRSLEGRELEEHEVLRRLGRYKSELVARGVDPVVLTTKAVDDAPDGPRSITRALARLIIGDRRSRQEYRRLASAICSSPALRSQAREILPLARRLCRDRIWLSRYQELRWLMSSWRFFHRWLAIVMLLVVCFHVVIAVRFGNLWVLAGGR